MSVYICAVMTLTKIFLSTIICSPATVLGEGSFGKVHKAMLRGAVSYEINFYYAFHSLSLHVSR